MASNSTQSTSLTLCKQWWRRSSSKKILLLLVWQVLFNFSWGIRESGGWNVFKPVIQISHCLSFLSAPLFVWLADKTCGRYEILKCGSLIALSSCYLISSTIQTKEQIKTQCDICMTGLKTFQPPDSRIPQEKLNNTCHTSSSNIFLLLDLLHHCLQRVRLVDCVEFEAMPVCLYNSD